MTAKDAILSVDRLTVSVGSRKLIENVSFDLARGEILTVIGPNGGGKTTLLRAVIGAVVPTSGTVTRAKSLRIGYTPQRLTIERSLPLTVDRFLALAGPTSANSRQAILNKTDILYLQDSLLADLSGGETQRVLFARALLRQPDLLILDEPTQGLDQPGEERFYGLLAEIRAELGIAVLMVSHDLHVVMAGSDKVICLNGHVCCFGAPEAVSVDPTYLELFGRRANLALYQHHHDHSHDGHHHEGHHHG
jgi:zinc transport system ATP-binding protein